MSAVSLKYNPPLKLYLPSAANNTNLLSLVLHIALRGFLSNNDKPNSSVDPL